MSESEDVDPFEDYSSDSSSYKPSETSVDSESDDETQTKRDDEELSPSTSVQVGDNDGVQDNRDGEEPLLSTTVQVGDNDGVQDNKDDEEPLLSTTVQVGDNDGVQDNRDDEEPSPSTSFHVPDDRFPVNNKNTRKRRSQPNKWKVNILKEKHQSGQEYINHKGSFIPAKRVKTTKDCLNSCKFECSKKITDSERHIIFTNYYQLSQNEKHMFILNTSTRSTTVRPNKNLPNSKRKFSYSYYLRLNNDKIHVCKKFYLGTLSISQKPVYNAHNSKNDCNAPKPDGRGKNNRRKISEDRVKIVKDHINCFPKVESHYCRSSTKREYLESSLTLRKMYELYTQKCSQIGVEPVKFSMYRFIFNTQFNLSFHIRKSDRCDLCEEYDIAKRENTLCDDLKVKYEQHVTNKKSMRAERKKDRNNRDIPVLCFDLQNVITLPRADISSFFYRKKLTVYNLTAHFSTSKTKYCAIWTERASGRGGNELASAFKKILEKAAEEHHFTKLITWSDSCIPQNRNSFISTAVLHFLRDNPHVTEIRMKYSTPGHSCIQEVDSAHSAIEKAMESTEIYSPIGLIRLLKSINPTHPFRVIQLQDYDFKDYKSVAKNMYFKDVPFTSVCCLRFTQNLFQIGFLTSFTHSMFRVSNLRGKNLPDREKKTNVPKSNKSAELKLTDLTPKNLKNPTTNDKTKDIKCMLKFMPQPDQQFYKALYKI